MTSPAIVFDCTVFVQAMLNPTGISARCLDIARVQAWDVWHSDELVDELLDVLNRPRFRVRYPHLTDQSIAAFKQILTDSFRCAGHVNPVIRLIRDPNDEHVINLCNTIRADYLVTNDQDFLTLDSGTHPDFASVRTVLPQLTIVTPTEILVRLARP